MEPVNENKEIEEVKEETVVEPTSVVPETTEVPVDPAKADMVKKIKLGIVAVGGVFILIAVLYIAAIAGGRNKAIEEEKQPIVVVIPTEAPEEVTPEPEPTVEVV